MELTDLKYFLAVAEELSFTKAAERLLISQPSLSQRIAKLERELGGPLFERTPKGLVLTASGRDFKRRAQSITAEAVRAAQAFQASMDGATGSVSIGASGSLAASLLPSLISRYCSRWPDVELHVTERRTPELISLMEAGSLDVSLIYAPHPPTRIPMTVLFDVPLIAITRRDHAVAGRDAVSIREFSGDGFILLSEPDESYYHFIMELCGRQGFSPRTICTGVEVQTACRLVEEGFGIAVVSSLGFDQGAVKSIGACRLSDEGAFTSVALLSQDPSRMSPAARRFRAIVVANRGPLRDAECPDPSPTGSQS